MRTSTVLCVLVAIVVSAVLVADGAHPHVWKIQDPLTLILTPLQLSQCRDRSATDKRIIASCSNAISSLRAFDVSGGRTSMTAILLAP
jgi:hypothetical protein